MKRLALFAGIPAAVLLAAALVSTSRDRVRPAPTPATFEVDIPTAQEIRAMLSAYGQRVEENERSLADLKAELERSRTALEQSVAATAESQRRDITGLESLLKGGVDPEPPDPTARFRSIEFQAIAPPARHVHIPAGSFGEATLLTGAFAPTGGEALPVLLRLDAALMGPNRSRIPIRGAFLVGKAQGDANSARAVIQLDTLSTLRPDGRVIETKVNGWVVDDDGVQGVRGEYVWRATEIAALAAATGGLSAAAEAVAARESIVQSTPLGGAMTAVTGDPGRFAGYRALGGAADRISEIVAKRLNEITPAVHVPNGRRVTVAFITGAALDGLVPDGAAGEAPFQGLDLEEGKR